MGGKRTLLASGPSGLCVVHFAFFVVPLQHLVCLVNQAVCLGNTFAQAFLTGLDFAGVLFAALSAFLHARHSMVNDLSRRPFPNSCS